MNLQDKKPLIAGIGVVGLAIVAWLAFGFFGIQAAFIDNEVSESADDLFTAAPAEVEEADDSEAAVKEEAVEEPAAEAVAEEAVTEEAVEEAPAAEEPVVEEVVVEEVEDDAAAADAAAAEAASEEAATAEEAAAEEAAATPGEIVTIASGNFGSLNDYAVSGNALVLNNGTDQRFLRFENFASDNGPDLKVYLRAANGEFVSLGNLTGNIGDQNYEIPAGVDLGVFNSVEIWCERFSVGFGVAALS